MFIALDSGIAECHQADLEVRKNPAVTAWATIFLFRRFRFEKYIKKLEPFFSGATDTILYLIQAIFGRSATPRGTLGLQRGGSRGGCGSAGGGTIAATENLDGLIAALHCNVAIAGMLADQGERLR